VVVASIDTYLKYSEAVSAVAPVARPAGELQSADEVRAERDALRAELATRRAGRRQPPRRKPQG
jgi:hypothetical protein